MSHLVAQSGFELFAKLIEALGQTTKTNEKLKLLMTYFAVASNKDKVWAIALFTGRRPKRLINPALMADYCRTLTNIPHWLYTECYGVVGDSSETIALLLHEFLQKNAENENSTLSLSAVLEAYLGLSKAKDEEKRQYLHHYWSTFNQQQVFVFNKLMSANFRVGVSENLVIQALAGLLQKEPSDITHRLSGQWQPLTETFETLLQQATSNGNDSKPYPFYLASPIEAAVHILGEPALWFAEWKWDGIRGQIIKRNDTLFIWSRGEELLTDKFPEFQQLLTVLPNGVCLDGEIVHQPMPAVIANDGFFLPGSFAALQHRIGRKQLSKKMLANHAVAFIAYDILEFKGNDVRHWPFIERRNCLENLVKQLPPLLCRLSPLLFFEKWETLHAVRTECRTMRAEGLMLKNKQSTYQTGRKRGDWWKWKIDPLHLDAVLIYAQKGTGRRSNLYTDYTFALKDGDKLVPFAKAYSGLTDKEMAEVDAFVKKNAKEKFGPVRTVVPLLVFEIGFEGIAISTRHKIGIAVRFPRILRWRTDKTPEDINTLDDLKKLQLLFENEINTAESNIS